MMLRHTQPDIAVGICYGQLDLDVGPGFERDACAAYEQLPNFDIVITSPLKRCLKLATYVSERAGLAYRVDNRLKEMDFGRWEGKLWDEIPRVEIDSWANDFMHAKPHGGESVQDMQQRVERALQTHDERDGVVLLVTHLGVMRCALARGISGAAYDLKVPYGGLIHLKKSEP